MITMKEYLEKALTENKGYLVFGNNRKEYLSKFDFEGKYQLGWTKDKKKAMVFPDKGSAKAALDRTLGSKFGSIIKEQKECPDGKVWCEMEQKCITKEEMEKKRKRNRKGKMDEAGFLGPDFSGYHIKDNILDDITIEELIDTVYSNTPRHKIDNRAVMKAFKELVKMRMKDAEYVAKKVVPDITMYLVSKI